MSCTARDIHDDMLNQAFNEAGLPSYTMSHLFALFTVQVILAPEENSAFLCEAKSMVSSALDLGDGKLLSEKSWSCDELRP